MFTGGCLSLDLTTLSFPSYFMVQGVHVYVYYVTSFGLTPFPAHPHLVEDGSRRS